MNKPRTAFVAGTLILALAGPLGGSLADQERDPLMASSSLPVPVDEHWTLLYLQGSQLKTTSETATVLIRDLGSKDVRPSPDGNWYAVVRSSTGVGENTGAAATMEVVKHGTWQTFKIGEGIAPAWSPSGKRLAFLRPVHDPGCLDEGCDTETKVMIKDMNGRSLPVTNQGQWSILGWLGERVLISTASEGGRVFSLDPATSQDPVRVIDLPLGSVWKGSPDGRWLVTVEEGTVTIYPMIDGRLAGPGRTVQGVGWTLGEGSWDPDSDRIAAVALDGTLLGKGNRLIVFGPELLDPATVQGSRGATGQVTWHEREPLVAFSAVARGGRSVIRFCQTEGDRRCRTSFSWRSWVKLIRFN